VNPCHRITIIVMMGVGLAAPEISAAQVLAAVQKVNQEYEAAPGLHDFDFLFGHWQVHHRKLKERLANDREWVEWVQDLKRVQ
jgi:hypothetical protein